MTDKVDFERLFQSETYASTYKRGELVTQAFAELLVNQSKVTANSKAHLDQPLVILDNACGTGVVSSALNIEVDAIIKQKWKLTCGDISTAVLAYTELRIQQEGWENAETKIVDAQKPDLPSNYYSHVFSGFAYQALPKSLQALDESVRILQPGGTIAFSTWFEPGWVSIARETIESMPGNLPFPEVHKLMSGMTDGDWHSKAWIESQLEERGFEDIDVRVEKTNVTLTPSVFIDMTLLVLPVMIMSYWTEDQRKANADKVRPAMENYLEHFFGGSDVETEWVAILSTARKPQ